MTMIDVFTVSGMSGVVVFTCAIVFLVDTIRRKESEAGLMWSVAFIAAALGQLCLLARAVSGDVWIATSFAAAAHVATTGFIWLGCRRFNRRGLRIAGPVVAVATVAGLVGALVAGPDGGRWAGVPVTSLALAAVALAGAVEASGGRMRLDISAIGLAVVLGQQGLFSLGQAAVYVAGGGASDVFRVWFGTVPHSVVTCVLIIVGVVTMSVLRASEAGLGARRGASQMAVTEDGFLLGDSFHAVFADLLRRAERSSVPVGVVAMRIDEITEVATAFGSDEAQRILAAWRAGVSRAAPAASIVGDHSATCMFIGFHPASASDARRTASAVHARLMTELTAATTVVTPNVAIGLATTGPFPYDADTLIEAAQAAARRSASSADLSVVVAGDD